MYIYIIAAVYIEYIRVIEYSYLCVCVCVCVCVLVRACVRVCKLNIIKIIGQSILNLNIDKIY